LLPKGRRRERSLIANPQFKSAALDHPHLDSLDLWHKDIFM
jgi:hypothetical protein